MAMARTHSKWINGAQVWYPDDNRQRWLEAYGDNVVKYIDDFVVTPKATAVATVANNPEWTISMVEGGGDDTKVQAADLKGGWMNISPDSSENDGSNMQHANESFRAESNSPIYFGIRYKVSEATQDDLMFGLCEEDTSILTNTSHGIYFKKVDGGTSLTCGVIRDETSVATLIADASFAADTVYIDEFLVSSTGRVEFWHNGSTIGVYSAGIPSTDLAVSIQFLTGAATSTVDLWIDWIRCIQLLGSRAT